MEKNKFCEELKRKGYDAYIEGGVVMVRKPGKAEEVVKEIKAIAEKLEYNQSIGVKIVKAAPAKTDDTNDSVMNDSVVNDLEENESEEETKEENEFFDEDDAEDFDAEPDVSSFEQMSLFGDD